MDIFSIVLGVGKTASDVVILCQEQVSIFVDCTAYKLSISNMTFESEIQGMYDNQEFKLQQNRDMGIYHLWLVYTFLFSC